MMSSLAFVGVSIATVAAAIAWYAHRQAWELCLVIVLLIAHLGIGILIGLRVPRNSRQVSGSLNPIAYPKYRRYLARIRIRQALRRFVDKTDIGRNLVCFLVGVFVFAIALTTAMFTPLPLVLGLSVAAAASVEFSIFLFVLVDTPTDGSLAASRRLLEEALPALREEYLAYLQKLDDERKHKAELRRQAAEERRRQLEEIMAAGNAARIEFSNKTHEPALVKVIGPTDADVFVSVDGLGSAVGLKPGKYHIKVRYGAAESSYHYTEGDPFDLQASAYARITLHTVVGGNYHARPISKSTF